MVSFKARSSLEPPLSFSMNSLRRDLLLDLRKKETEIRKPVRQFKAFPTLRAGWDQYEGSCQPIKKLAISASQGRPVKSNRSRYSLRSMFLLPTILVVQTP